jgi:phosphoribosylamine--glycine ligase
MSSSCILIVGSGGREHALAVRLARDPGEAKVLLAPGNPGAARKFPCLPIAEDDAPGLIAAARRERVSLVVIGPEAPLAAGLADALREGGLTVFGPSRAAAQLESSKWFAKQVMGEAGVPTARAEHHVRVGEARAALVRFEPPWVLKADGLAAGKGVCVTREREDAEAFLFDCLERDRFGPGGRSVVVEEFLAGEEASVMAVCDGRSHVLLPAARDYNRAFDGDRGPNTGGMGAYAPARVVDAELERTIATRIVSPVLDAMAGRGAPFRGVLYCGLMIAAGSPRVVEFNVRFGDPETQVVLPLVAGSLAGLLEGAALGSLAPAALGREAGAAVAVALADEGYPGAVRGGGRIEGLDALEGDHVTVLHAATEKIDDAWRVRGGRAAYVVATGTDREQARGRAYHAIDGLRGTGWRCRRDVAADFGLSAGAPPATAFSSRAGGG